MYNILVIIGLGSSVIGYNTQFNYNVTISRKNMFIKNIYIVPEVNVGIRGDVEIMGIIGAGF